MGTTVVLHSPRGGAGTSTLALALAQKLATQSHSTCLVELATFGSVVPMLKLPEHPGWGHLAGTFATAAIVAAGGGEPGVMTTGARAAGANAVGSSAAAADIAPELQAALADVSEYTGSPLWCLLAAATVMDRLGAWEAETVLAHLESMFDFVVVDTPAELSERTAAAFTLAQPLVLLCPPDFQNAYRLLQLQAILTQLRVEPYRVLLVGSHTAPDGGPGLSDLATLMPYRVVGQIPMEKAHSIAVARSRWTGFKRGSAPDQAVERLAEYVVSGDWRQPAPSGRGAVKGTQRTGTRA